MNSKVKNPLFNDDIFDQSSSNHISELKQSEFDLFSKV